MRKIREILRLKHEAKLTDRQIARGAGASRWAVASCLAQATAVGISWPLCPDLDEEALEVLLYPPEAASPRHPLPDFDAIQDSFSKHKGVTRRLAWEEYRQTHPSGMGYSAFCLRYRDWLKAQDLVLRLPHEPGEALYVDYAGQTAQITDRETGELRKVKVFVAVNLFVCGPTGVGKSYIACALGHAACRQDLSVRYLRLPRLVEELVKAEALQKKSGFFKTLAKARLLIIDDFGLAPLADQTKRDLLEILDDRYDKASTIITSQLPVEKWHAYLDEPTLADAILDRLVHNAHRINLTGDSMRKRRAQA